MTLKADEPADEPATTVAPSFVVVAQVCDNCGRGTYVRGPFSTSEEAATALKEWGESEQHPAEALCVKLAVVRCGDVNEVKMRDD